MPNPYIRLRVSSRGHPRQRIVAGHNEAIHRNHVIRFQITSAAPPDEADQSPPETLNPRPESAAPVLSGDQASRTVTKSLDGRSLRREKASFTIDINSRCTMGQFFHAPVLFELGGHVGLPLLLLKNLLLWLVLLVPRFNHHPSPPFLVCPPLSGTTVPTKQSSRKSSRPLGPSRVDTPRTIAATDRHGAPRGPRG